MSVSWASPGPGLLAHSGLTDIQDRFNPKNGTKTISIKFKTTFSSPLYERSRAKETLKNTKEKECTTEQGQSVKKKPNLYGLIMGFWQAWQK